MNALMKQIKERMTKNAWNNLGQLNWTLPSTKLSMQAEADMGPKESGFNQSETASG